MGIQVTCTCGWCLGKTETTVGTPLPKGWITKQVASSKVGAPAVDETFCSEKCRDWYAEAAPKAHDAAANDYTAKFWAEMNVQRAQKK